MTTTSDTTKIENLGINPGIAETLKDVSLEPINFRHVESHNGDDFYEAVHSSYSLTTDQRIEVQGHIIAIGAKKSQSYAKLLEEWKAYYRRQMEQQWESENQRNTSDWL